MVLLQALFVPSDPLTRRLCQKIQSIEARYLVGQKGRINPDYAGWKICAANDRTNSLIVPGCSINDDLGNIGLEAQLINIRWYDSKSHLLSRIIDQIVPFSFSERWTIKNIPDFACVRLPI
jgi:hypothetical protein